MAKGRKVPMGAVDIVVTLDPEQLVEDLSYQVADDLLVRFVKALDEKVASWDFSEQLYRYFKAQHKIFKAEVKGD